MSQQPLAYLDTQFLESEEGRPLRILSEYLEPLRRFKDQRIQDTVVFFGSARASGRGGVERALRTLRGRGAPGGGARAGRERGEGPEPPAPRRGVGPLLRGRARARTAADGVERLAAVRESPL